MDKFRLIVDPPLSGPINMAKDHAILYGISHKELLSALRIYRWVEPTVTIGSSENINLTVNKNYCDQKNIPIIRRESGGGTVLHHKELTYSFTIPLSSNLIPQSVEESFKRIVSPIINTLKMYIDGVEYRPVNDIVINKRKISGSAQTRKYGVLQQHGTVIMEIDDEILTSAICYDEYKLVNRGFSSPRQSLTSLKDEVGRNIDERFIEEFVTSLISNFSKEFGLNFVNSDILESENTVMKTYEKKFASEEWNMKK